MMESRTGVVEIEDVDPADLELFLRYLYTGKLKDVYTRARGLYILADTATDVA